MAFDFDLLCTVRLFYYDNDRAQEPLETMMAAMGGGQPFGKKTTQPVQEPEEW